MPRATLTASRFLLASLFLGLMYGKKAIETIKAASLSDLILLVSTGISGVAMTHFFQVARRYGFAPSASDAAFLLNLVPVFVVIFALLSRLEKPSLGKLAVVGAGTLGMITILTNWEKPSSFSPFSLFRFEETLLLSSAFFLALFVVGAKKLVERQFSTRPDYRRGSLEHDYGSRQARTLLYSSSERAEGKRVEKYSPTVLATLAVWAGTIPLVILALVTDGPLAAFSVPIDGWIVVIILGTLSSALFFLLFFDALALTTASQVSSAFFLTPTVITVMIVFERLLGFQTMPSPLFVLPIVIGSFLVVLGVVSLWIEQSKSF